MRVLVFPGQGSQFVGMGRFLADNFPLAHEVFEEASDCLKQDFKKLCLEDPNKTLHLTENTQPALLCLSYMYYKCLSAEVGDLQYVASAGHSLGEYSALVCNNVFQFTEGLKLVKQRGLAMQKAVPVGIGAMLAVLKIEEEDLNSLLKAVYEHNPNWVLQAANFNSPGQIVISGHKEACDFLSKELDINALSLKAKPRFIPLKVSAPFHCKLMMPAQEKMEFLLKDTPFNDSSTPIFQNYTAEGVSSAENLRNNLIQQVSNPVRWQQSIEALKKLGAQEIIELGPGKVLTGLVKKIDSEHWKTLNIENIEDFKNFVTGNK